MNRLRRSLLPLLLCGLVAVVAAPAASAVQLPASAQLHPSSRSVDGSSSARLYRRHQSLRLQLRLRGLPASHRHQSYAVWIELETGGLLPLLSTHINRTGRKALDIPVVRKTLRYLGSTPAIVVTRVNNHRLFKAVTVATRRHTTPSYIGVPLLRGRLRAD